MRLLITGSRGYLGSRLLDYLRAQDPRASILGVSRHSRRQGELACQFDNALSVRKTLVSNRPDIVFHCVGTTLPGPWEALVRAHLLSTINVLEAVRAFPGKKPRVVIIGSAAEYGAGKPGARFSEKDTPRPETPYGLSKYLQTSLAMAYARLGVPVVAARLFNLLVPDAPPAFAVSRVIGLLRGIPRGASCHLKVGPMNAIRDFLPLEEVFRALYLLGRDGKPGEIYNVCSGQGTRMGDLFDALADAAGVRVDWGMEGKGSQRFHASISVGNGAKIRRHTGWFPKSSFSTAVKTLVRPMGKNR
ncbi:MAG: NAD(P)-dependent oxidoreductase [Elusimicrobia bacterium]|nr:NAD(P)-dependent oxidoreductase [Elusimicrobiota bacterium]